MFTLTLDQKVRNRDYMIRDMIDKLSEKGIIIDDGEMRPYKDKGRHGETGLEFQGGVYVPKDMSKDAAKEIIETEISKQSFFYNTMVDDMKAETYLFIYFRIYI